MASETDFGDQVVGLLRRMELPGMANAIGKTRATMPGPVLGSSPEGRSGAGIPWGNSFQMDRLPDPQTVAMAFGPGILAGPRAIGAPLQALREADPLGLQTQWRQRGVSMGADNKPRWEIQDTPSSMSPWVHEHFRGPERHGIGDIMKGQVGDFLQHEKLFEAYPELKHLSMEVERLGGRLHGGYGQYTPSHLTTFLPGARVRVSAFEPRQLHDILLHELQHGVQDIEGFARGGTPSTRQFVDFWNSQPHKDKAMKELEGLTQRLWQAKDAESVGYTQMAGETEARNVQSRFRNPDLYKFAPKFTEDVPRDWQIVAEPEGVATYGKGK